MRIVYPTKSGRGVYCAMFGKKRCTHGKKLSLEGCGIAPLLLSDKLGVSGTGHKPTTPSTSSVVSKLERLSLAPKKNNIRFDI
jgi:hypothetical protein